MNEQQWEEIKIEDVQPGDVARCNGREFPVESFPGGWGILLGKGQGNYRQGWMGWSDFGFTFHRKVKREPLRFTALASGNLIDRAKISLPPNYAGKFFRVTELLDGENGA